MEQAGYDFEDSEHLLPPESLDMLVEFHWKSQLLAGVGFSLFSVESS